MLARVRAVCSINRHKHDGRCAAKRNSLVDATKQQARRQISPQYICLHFLAVS